MQNLNASFSVFKAFNLIGKHVVASIRDSSTNNLKTVDGVVSGVKINAGTAYVVIGSEDVPVDNITSIANDKASPKSE